MKKILFVHDYPPLNGGGLAIYVNDLIAELKGKYSCKIITSRLKDSFTNNYEIKGYRNILFDENIITLILKLIKGIIISDLVVINFTFSFRTLSVISLIITFIKKKNSILILHTNNKHMDYVKGKGKQKNKFIKNILITILRIISYNCKKIIVFNKKQKREFDKLGFKNLINLPMFVDESKYLENYQFALKTNKKKNIYYIGELSYLKCFDKFINNIKGMKYPYNIIVIGDGNLKKNIEKLMKKNERIMIYMTMGHKKLVKLLKDVYLLFFPSINDTWGRIVIECILSGVIIMANEIPIIEDLKIKNYINIKKIKNIDKAINYINTKINYKNFITEPRNTVIKSNMRFKKEWINMINSLTN